jgi:hypothetical protein
MANQRGTFAKRQREMDLKDKARQKEARRAARRDNRGGGGPQIDWSAEVNPTNGPVIPDVIVASRGPTSNDDK